MKLFSRKALVAGAAAVTLSFAGASAAIAEEPGTVTTTSEAPSGSSGLGGTFSSSTAKKTAEPSDGEGGEGGAGTTNPDDSKGSSDIEAGEITAWISVFTAVIGALGALFSFATKYLGFKL